MANSRNCWATKVINRTSSFSSVVFNAFYFEYEQCLSGVSFHVYSYDQNWRVITIHVA